MRLPNRSRSGYAARTAVVVLTLAALQYAGLVVDGRGIDPGHLAAVAVLFPAFSYLIDVVVANARATSE